jgi:sugar phosphate isomerase/epimerase
MNYNKILNFISDHSNLKPKYSNMNSSRRSFIRTSAIAVAATAIMNKSVFASALKTDLVGVQLYSIREDMKSDPLGSLEKVAGMGYKNVEHANYVDHKFYGFPAAEFKKVLDGLGLKMPSGHTVLEVKHWDSAKNDVTESGEKTVEDAAVVGQSDVISPWMDESFRKSYDDLNNCLDMFNRSGELCKKSGMKFGYHNHDFEFIQVLNNEKVFDIIMRTIDPDLVALQLDIGNLYNGGAIAADVMKKYPNRFETIHVKDEIPATEGNEKYESCILGKGIVNAKEVIDMATKSGSVRSYIVEQESYQGMSPMDSIKEDLAVMRQWGY